MNPKYLSLSLALFVSQITFAQDYAIHLVRPMKVNEQYKIEATGTTLNAMTFTSNGNVVKDNKEEFSVDYKSVEKVLSVDAVGRETKTSSTIEKLVKTQEGSSKELLPKGTVVVSSVAGKKQVHEIDGKPVDGAVAKALDLVISLSKGDADDDRIFGTKERKKAGDSWDINAAAIEENFSRSFDAKVSEVSGKTTLVGLVKDQAGEALNINAHCMAKVQPPLPPAFTVDSSIIDGNFGGLFLLDAAAGRGRDTINISFAFTAHADAPSGEKVVLKVKSNSGVIHSQERL